MIKRVAIYAAHEDVLVAVIVVIADRHAGIVSGSGQARLRGDVLEMTCAVILEQAVRVFRRALFERRDIGSVREEDIQLAVIVVIEDGDTAGHCFRRVALGRFTILQREIDWPVSESDGTLARRRANQPHRGSRYRRNSCREGTNARHMN